MSWDPVQREVLDALGHTLYRIAPVGAPSLQADLLQQALLRAAGRTAEADDAASLCRAWTSLRLRGNASAKRALWPQLRALRVARPE